MIGQDRSTEEIQTEEQECGGRNEFDNLLDRYCDACLKVQVVIFILSKESNFGRRREITDENLVHGGGLLFIEPTPLCHHFRFHRLAQS